MSTDVPEPLVPANVDLRDFEFMPLDVQRLRDSRIAAARMGEEFRAAMLLWCAAWHQLSAGSVPDDDIELAQLAGFGRCVKEWRRVRKKALWGWVKCRDGRLYHRVIAEKAVESWNKRLQYHWRKECDRVRKENKLRKERGEPLVELPPRPAPISTDTGAEVPAEFQRNSDGIPAENSLKGEGEGQGDLYKKLKALSRDFARDASPPVSKKPELPPPKVNGSNADALLVAEAASVIAYLNRATGCNYRCVTHEASSR